MASKIKDWYRGPDCVICSDSGLHDKCGDYQFCRCPAGVKYQAQHPDAARDANERIKGLRARTA